MKPLVLTWHPKLEDTNLSAYDIHEGRKTERRLRLAKRLTDAELAAEYWKAACIDECFMNTEDAQGPAYDRAFSQTITLKRFATLPHYDEVTE